VDRSSRAGSGSVASFRTQVSRTIFKVRLGGPQRVLAPSTLDELNRLLISHALAAVTSPRLRQPA
jgi:hypothetical protein